VDARPDNACPSAVFGLNQRRDKHVDARGDSHQDRGSTPLASIFSFALAKEKMPRRSREARRRAFADVHRALQVYGLASQQAATAKSIAFRSKEKAVVFEQYLKSGSGREFARRHF
jgi:hypothetical protein